MHPSGAAQTNRQQTVVRRSYNGGVISKLEWIERQQQWAEFDRWARSAAAPEHPPEHAIADVGTILDWIPPAVQVEDRDPERLGVQRMHALLSFLKSDERE